MLQTKLNAITVYNETKRSGYHLAAVLIFFGAVFK